MNTVRDAFITKFMGLCWHEFYSDVSKGCICKHCGLDLKCLNLQHPNFSSYEDFGKLKELVCKSNFNYRFFHVYIDELTLNVDNISEIFERLTPDHFADALYKYILDNENIIN